MSWIPNYASSEVHLKKILFIPEAFHLLIGKSVQRSILGDIVVTKDQPKGDGKKAMYLFKKALFKEFGQDDRLRCSITLPRCTLNKMFQKFHGNCRSFKEHLSDEKLEAIDEEFSLPETIKNPLERKKISEDLAAKKRSAILAESIKYIAVVTFALKNEQVSQF